MKSLTVEELEKMFDLVKGTPNQKELDMMIYRLIVNHPDY